MLPGAVLDRGIRILPVLDEIGRPVGSVGLLRQLEVPGEIVADIMHPRSPRHPQNTSARWSTP
jgi:hypothetical protein